MRAVIIPAHEPDENLVTIINQLWEAGITMVVVDDGSGKEYQSVFEKPALCGGSAGKNGDKEL